MDKTTYLSLPEVKGFISWLINALPSLQVYLKIKQSRFVPVCVDVRLNSFSQIIDCYVWKSNGSKTGDWNETNLLVKSLSQALGAAVQAKNNAHAISVCDTILAWGGDRNPAVGASPFLHSMAPDTLCNYISNVGSQFILNSANLDELAPPVTLMNSMLTKVHAMYATDGLPIYDSRVAAAIASLVELWRRCADDSGNALPQSLAFPATMKNRSVTCIFPDAAPPGVLAYGAANVGTTAKRWSAAKVRLGWIIEDLLVKSPDLLLQGKNLPLADKIRAFEASLFMIGYNVKCLKVA
jgi:hypothetical protein